MNRNPLDQLRALRQRRAQERQQPDRRNPYRYDTQPLTIGRPENREGPTGRTPGGGRRALVVGLAVGAVAGGTLAFGLPALAGGSHDAASQNVSTSSLRSAATAGGDSTGNGRTSPGAGTSTPPSPEPASRMSGDAAAPRAAGPAPRPPAGRAAREPACGKADGPAAAEAAPRADKKAGPPAPRRAAPTPPRRHPKHSAGSTPQPPTPPSATPPRTPSPPPAPGTMPSGS